MNKLVIIALFLCLCSTASADNCQSEGKETGSTQSGDSIFGEDGSYNVSVDGAGVKFHGEYDEKGKPKAGGKSGEQAVEAVGRDFHEQRKADRRDRKALLREQKKQAKEARK